MSLQLNRVDTINLIRIYGEYECLWNCRKKSYKRHDLKKEAWDAIANYFGTSVTEIKKKLKYLRTAYVAERRKLNEWQKKSVNTTKPYQPKLFYFNDFSYLDSTIVLRRQFSDGDYEDGDGDVVTQKIKETPCEEESNAASEPLQDNESVDWHSGTAEDYLEEEDLTRGDFKRIKLSTQLKSNTSDDSIQSTKNNECSRNSNIDLVADDMYLAFGKSVGLQLRNLKPVNAAKAMAQIQERLTEYAISEA